MNSYTCKSLIAAAVFGHDGEALKMQDLLDTSSNTPMDKDQEFKEAATDYVTDLPVGDDGEEFYDFLDAHEDQFPYVDFGKPKYIEQFQKILETARSTTKKSPKEPKTRPCSPKDEPDLSKLEDFKKKAAEFISTMDDGKGIWNFLCSPEGQKLNIPNEELGTYEEMFEEMVQKSQSAQDSQAPRDKCVKYLEDEEAKLEKLFKKQGFFTHQENARYWQIQKSLKKHESTLLDAIPSEVVAQVEKFLKRGSKKALSKSTLKFLGRGQYGQTFRVRYRSKRCVLKIVHGTSFDEVQQEAKYGYELWKKSNGRSLQTYAWGPVSSSCFEAGTMGILMENGGDTLSKCLKHQQMSEKNKIRIIKDILWQVLIMWEAMGVTHDDIHSANILVKEDEDGAMRAAVIDFGGCLPVTSLTSGSTAFLLKHCISNCLWSILGSLRNKDVEDLITKLAADSEIEEFIESCKKFLDFPPSKMHQSSTDEYDIWEEKSDEMIEELKNEPSQSAEGISPKLPKKAVDPPREFKEKATDFIRKLPKVQDVEDHFLDFLDVEGMEYAKYMDDFKVLIDIGGHCKPNDTQMKTPQHPEFAEGNVWVVEDKAAEKKIYLIGGMHSYTEEGMREYGVDDEDLPEMMEEAKQSWSLTKGDLNALDFSKERVVKWFTEYGNKFEDYLKIGGIEGRAFRHYERHFPSVTDDDKVWRKSRGNARILDLKRRYDVLSAKEIGTVFANQVCKRNEEWKNRLTKSLNKIDNGRTMVAVFGEEHMEDLLRRLSALKKYDIRRIVATKEQQKMSKMKLDVDISSDSQSTGCTSPKEKPSAVTTKCIQFDVPAELDLDEEDKEPFSYSAKQVLSRYAFKVES